MCKFQIYSMKRIIVWHHSLSIPSVALLHVHDTSYSYSRSSPWRRRPTQRLSWKTEALLTVALTAYSGSSPWQLRPTQSLSWKTEALPWSLIHTRLGPHPDDEGLHKIRREVGRNIKAQIHLWLPVLTLYKRNMPGSNTRRGTWDSNRTTCLFTSPNLSPSLDPRTKFNQFITYIFSSLLFPAKGKLDADETFHQRQS